MPTPTAKLTPTDTESPSRQTRMKQRLCSAINLCIFKNKILLKVKVNTHLSSFKISRPFFASGRAFERPDHPGPNPGSAWGETGTGTFPHPVLPRRSRNPEVDLGSPFQSKLRKWIRSWNREMTSLACWHLSAIFRTCHLKSSFRSSVVEVSASKLLKKVLHFSFCWAKILTTLQKFANLKNLCDTKSPRVVSRRGNKA